MARTFSPFNLRRTLVAVGALCALAPTSSHAKKAEAPARSNAVASPLNSAATAWQQSIARATGLPAAPIQIVAGDAAMLKRLLLSAMQRQYPGDTLAWMTQVYGDIGLLDDKTDLKAAALSLYEEQVVGFFDPNSHVMAVMQSAAPSAQEQVLRHELVHAQQDALVPLEPLIEAAIVDDDRALAGQAVLAGQAIVARSAAALSVLSAPRATAIDETVGFALKDAGIDISDDELEGLLGAQADLSALSESAATLLAGNDAAALSAPSLPQDNSRVPYLQAQLLFPYQQGAQFIASLQKGSTLPAVVATTLRRLPQSTREILHPELYRSGYVPTRLVLSSLQSVANHEVLFATTVGELNVRTLLGGSQEGQAQAALLRADRLLLVRGPEGAWHTAWLSQWQDDKAAIAFVTALKSRWRLRGRPTDNVHFVRGGRTDGVWQQSVNVAVFSQPLGDPSPLEAALRQDLARLGP